MNNRKRDAQHGDPLSGRRVGPGDFAKVGLAILAMIGVTGATNWFKQHILRRELPDERTREREALRRMGHEGDDVNVGCVVSVIVALFISLGIISVALFGLFGYFEANIFPQSTQPAAQSVQQPPEPRLQADLSTNLQRLNATEDATLHSYGWIDRQAGVVRIPIDRAIDLVAQRGVPGGGGTPQPASTPSGTPTASDAVNAGAQLFVRLGCVGCHRSDGSGAAPSLVGVFGSQVRLDNGATVIANEAYIRESILNPQAKVVAGYRPIMPQFQGQINETQLSQLVAYVQSLAK